MEEQDNIDGFPFPDSSDASSSTTSAQAQNRIFPKSDNLSGMNAPRKVITNTSQRRDLDFDPEDMVVDDLKRECRLRNLQTSGTKAILVKRLRDAVAQNPALPITRLTTAEKRRKRISNKREPQRCEFETEEEYQDAWHRWRDVRDHNNVSVKRSRQAARLRKEEHERLCQVRERENEELAAEVSTLQQDIVFLREALSCPSQVTTKQKEKLLELMSRIGPAPTVAGEGTSNTAPIQNFSKPMVQRDRNVRGCVESIKTEGTEKTNVGNTDTGRQQPEFNQGSLSHMEIPGLSAFDQDDDFFKLLKYNTKSHPSKRPK